MLLTRRVFFCILLKYRLIEQNSIEQKHFGNCDDTNKHLELGHIYEGTEEIHSWHTKIIIGKHKFNSVCFEKVN